MVDNHIRGRIIRQRRLDIITNIHRRLTGACYARQTFLRPGLGRNIIFPCLVINGSKVSILSAILDYLFDNRIIHQSRELDAWRLNASDRSDHRPIVRICTTRRRLLCCQNSRCRVADGTAINPIVSSLCAAIAAKKKNHVVIGIIGRARIL